MRSLVTIDHINLSVLHKNTDAPCAVIFIHGNSGSAHLWEPQFTDPLFDQYHLVAFDLPAHGSSSPSSSPDKAYSTSNLGGIMAKAIQQLFLHKPFVIGGVSFGSNIAAETLHELDPQGLFFISPSVLGPEHTVANVFRPGVNVGFMFSDERNADVVREGYRLHLGVNNDKVLDALVADYQAVKEPFRSSLGATVMAGEYSDEIQLLKDHGREVLCVFGEDDPSLNSNYLDDAPFRLWQDKVFAIPGSHFPNADHPREFNALLKEYCDHMFYKR
ncbi:MAG: hypothetical protein DI535_20990 [Citrobacter freundii]|nr:MAG: hypothetical protein DI535_20990 [Citrobacter freundii]